MKNLKARLSRPKFIIIVLSGALVCSLIVSIAALVGVRQLIEPPAKGQFHEVLQNDPIQNPSNTTGTLLENTVDELSGGVIPIILFPMATNFCGDDTNFDLKIAACVDRFDATYIAFSEELAGNLNLSYEDATAQGLTEEAELINQWERHLAAHEFAHILQYNYRTETLPFQENFNTGYLGRSNEDMAECYAQLRYPMTDQIAEKEGDSMKLSFHNFPAKETFALCTQDELDTIESWLEAIDYPVTDRS